MEEGEGRRTGRKGEKGRVRIRRRKNEDRRRNEKEEERKGN